MSAGKVNANGNLKRTLAFLYLQLGEFADILISLSNSWYSRCQCRVGRRHFKMASLKAVQIRMKSVNNIKKITSAMKMVSAAKFKHDERRMLNGVPFAKPVCDFMERKSFFG